MRLPLPRQRCFLCEQESSRVRITLQDTPANWFVGEGVGPGGRPQLMHVPMLLGHISRLPVELDALVLTSDLQARERLFHRSGHPPKLFGEAVAAELADWMRTQDLAPAETGVVLAGDFWSAPTDAAKRGGYGDVRPVWDAFADRFGRVVGVPGNHDLFEPSPSREPSAAAWRGDVQLLERSCIDWGGVSVSGVGGCVGNETRPFRYNERHQLGRLLQAVSEQPDLLLLHQGPPGDGRARGGAHQVEDCLRFVEKDTLVVCGHEHATRRVHEVGRAQVVNVHEAVLVLTRDHAP